MTHPTTDMNRHETAEVSEDDDRTTEALPDADLAAKFEDTAYSKHLWLIKQNTDLRVKIKQLEDAAKLAQAQLAEARAMVVSLQHINESNARAAIEHLRQRDEANACLKKCAELLNEVRTGEDFEVVCSEAADEANALLARKAAQ